MKPTYIYLTLIGIILILLFWNVENKQASEDYRIELEQQKATLKHWEDSLRAQIKEYQKADLRALQVIQEATIRADRAEAKLNTANEKIKYVRFVRFSSDSVRSGAISELYPSYKRPWFNGVGGSERSPMRYRP